MKLHDWEVRFFRKFLQLYLKLKADVETLRENDPEHYINRSKTRLLKKLQTVIRIVAEDPMHPDYLLGKTLGEKHKQWRRVKGKGLPDRYRLFFRFLEQHKQIVFAWLNDESTMRKAGSSSDVYRVFKGMLDREEVPTDFNALVAESKLIEPDKTDPDNI